MDLLEKYQGRRLSTDEVAEARTAISVQTRALEEIKLETGDDSLLLKWGTLKGWDLHSEKGGELLKKYHSLGSSLSAMAQEDTPEQKELILQMIDECDGVIQNDWDGDYYTKEQAKEYIMGYGK